MCLGFDRTIDVMYADLVVKLYFLVSTTACSITGREVMIDRFDEVVLRMLKSARARVRADFTLSLEHNSVFDVPKCATT